MRPWLRTSIEESRSYLLDRLEQRRKSTVSTGNARLAVIRSFFDHVATNDPALLAIAQNILAISTKKAHTDAPVRQGPKKSESCRSWTISP